MQEVFLKFADESFNTKAYFPNYNNMDTFIMQRINAIVGVGKPALFTWLDSAQQDAAKVDLVKMPLIPAANITNPVKNYNKYKPVLFDYFEIKKKMMAKKVADKQKKTTPEKPPKPEKTGLLKKMMPKFGKKIVPV